MPFRTWPERFGLDLEKLPHFCDVAAQFHQDFDLDGRDAGEVADDLGSWRGPEFRTALIRELAEVLNATADRNEFIMVFTAAGAENAPGDPYSELKAWLERQA